MQNTDPSACLDTVIIKKQTES